MEALSRQALRVLRLFGNTEATRVLTTVGPEQEYFLVDQALYNQREDLILTGRTLYGARSPKGQELEDHYFGAIKPRVKAFMEDLNDELWKLGVLAKTEQDVYKRQLLESCLRSRQSPAQAACSDRPSYGYQRGILHPFPHRCIRRAWHIR